MPRYRTHDGDTTAEDPARLLWYASCGYWTDDWDKLSRVGGGIPCCPVCRCPGFEVQALLWERGVADFAAVPGSNGYKEFVAESKEHCYAEIGGLLKAWEAYKAGHNV